MDAKMRDELSEWLAARSQDALPEEPDAVTQCKLTDLSLGGCYVETESPFPQSSAVDLCLRAAGMEIHAEGLVRVMHPGHGMGIEFPARTEEQRKSVGEFIEFLTSQPGATPQLESSPRSLVANQADLSPDQRHRNRCGRSSPGIAADRQWAGRRSFSRRTPPPAKSGERQPINLRPISVLLHHPDRSKQKNREPDRHPVFSVGPAPGGLFHLLGRRLPRHSS